MFAIATMATAAPSHAAGVCHRYGTSLPATCNAGECFLLTSMPRGWYDCTTTNVWTVWGLLATDDSVQVADGLVWQSRVLPSCSNGTTSKLLYNSTTNSFSCGTDQAGGGAAWGSITGTLSAQTDLQGALDGKEPAGVAFSELSGSATDAQIPDTITLTNLTQVGTRAISDTTGTLAVSRGGTNLTASADDNVMVGNATTWESKAVPDCDTGATSKLLYDTTTNAFSCGTDQTGGGGGPVVVRKSADQSSTVTTFADVTGMTFSLAASTSYSVVCDLSYLTAISTTALQVSLNGPASPTAVRFTVWTATSATASHNASQSAYEAVTNPASALTTALPARLTGTITNGANAGTLALRMRSEIATSSVTIQRGSWCALY